GPAFATFVEQPGTPELTASVTCEGGKAAVSLAQQRYLPPGAGVPSATKPWIVPVCVAYDGGGKRAEACTLLDQPTGSRAHEPRLVAEAVKLADHWRDLPQSVRGEILQIAVDAKPELFERILKDVATEPDRSRRQEMLAALANVRGMGRQKAALGLMLDD